MPIIYQGFHTNPILWGAWVHPGVDVILLSVKILILVLIGVDLDVVLMFVYNQEQTQMDFMLT